MTEIFVDEQDFWCVGWSITSTSHQDLAYHHNHCTMILMMVDCCSPCIHSTLIHDFLKGYNR
jgi:hypothetical protein